MLKVDAWWKRIQEEASKFDMNEVDAWFNTFFDPAVEGEKKLGEVPENIKRLCFLIAERERTGQEALDQRLKELRLVEGDPVELIRQEFAARDAELVMLNEHRWFALRMEFGAENAPGIGIRREGVFVTYKEQPKRTQQIQVVIVPRNSPGGFPGRFPQGGPQNC